MYQKITADIIEKLNSICGKEFVFIDSEILKEYSKDETEDLSYIPEVVVKPKSAKEISEILKLANEFSIPVYPRGGGTGLSGGALALYGGICLSLEKLNRIIEIDEKNFQAVVEPGVITQVFQEECEKVNLFFPPDPASRGSCFIGGNLAENSGGPRAAKYGVTKDYILALEFVTPLGDILKTGARVLKNVTGYNITQLLIGSEGTLGIITKIYLRLIPLPKYKNILLISFNSTEKCISAVAEYYRNGINPSALEFLEKSAIKAGEAHLKKKYPNSEAEAQLILELDGNYREVFEKEIEIISEVSENFGAVDIILLDDINKMNEIWEFRRGIGEAVKSISVYKEEDTVVPRYKLPELLKGIKEISIKYNITTYCYGHAGDGNVHCNVLKMDMSDEKWNEVLNEAVEEIFRLTVSLGGTISGEHGIGLTQKDFLHIALGEKEIELMKSIKKLFDPNNILNPGKIFK
jgi:glycolate oxidase